MIGHTSIEQKTIIIEPTEAGVRRGEGDVDGRIVVHVQRGLGLRAGVMEGLLT